MKLTISRTDNPLVIGKIGKDYKALSIMSSCRAASGCECTSAGLLVC